MAAVALTNMFVGVLIMCAFSRVVDLGVSCTDAVRVSLDTTGSVPVKFGKGELDSGIVRALLD